MGELVHFLAENGKVHKQGWQAGFSKTPEDFSWVITASTERGGGGGGMLGAMSPPMQDPAQLPAYNAVSYLHK